MNTSLRFSSLLPTLCLIFLGGCGKSPEMSYARNHALYAARAANQLPGTSVVGIITQPGTSDSPLLENVRNEYVTAFERAGMRVVHRESTSENQISPEDITSILTDHPDITILCTLLPLSNSWIRNAGETLGSVRIVNGLHTQYAPEEEVQALVNEGLIAVSVIQKQPTDPEILQENPSPKVRFAGTYRVLNAEP